MSLSKQPYALRALATATLWLIGLVSAHGQPTSRVSFVARQDYPTGRAPNAIAHADFNGDGIEDLVVPNSFQGSMAVNVLFGNGDGSFRTPVFVITGGQAPSTVAAADLNGDGIPDIVVGNILSGTVSVLLGVGDGTFRPPLIANTGGIFPKNLRVGDFNGDGIPDVATANQVSNNVSVLLGNGDGTLRLSQVVPVSDSPFSLAVGDLNNDGLPDLAVTHGGRPVTVEILAGTGDGTFTRAADVTLPVLSLGAAIADLDGDGHADLVLTDGDRPGLSVFFGNGDLTFQPAVSLPLDAAPSSVTVADLNADQVPDLVTANVIATAFRSSSVEGTVASNRFHRSVPPTALPR